MSDYDPNGGKPKPGEVSPLEGMGGPEARFLCDVVFSFMGFQMCRQLSQVMEMGPRRANGFEPPAGAPSFVQDPDGFVNAMRKSILGDAGDPNSAVYKQQFEMGQNLSKQLFGGFGGPAAPAPPRNPLKL